MDVQLINSELLESLYERASKNVRKREGFDLRTTIEDNSQRLLNVLQPGTYVP